MQVQSPQDFLISKPSFAIAMTALQLRADTRVVPNLCSDPPQQQKKSPKRRLLEHVYGHNLEANRNSAKDVQDVH